MIDIRSFTLEELKNELTAIGEKPFRAKQIFNWLHREYVSSFDEMTNISKALRQRLKENFSISKLNIVKKLESKEDGTNKYLFDLGDNI